jgi:hypothetical protein
MAWVTSEMGSVCINSEYNPEYMLSYPEMAEGWIYCCSCSIANLECIIDEATLLFYDLPNTSNYTFKKKNNLDDWLNFPFEGIIFNETYIYVTTLYAPGDRFE